MGLKQKLADFEQAYIKGEINESTISSRFKDIARSIIYGGYIDVYGEFKIYAKTIEFYFHEEEGSIKDPIVYHRNGKYGALLPFPPYFPMMSLHAHMSGFDITFESEEGKAILKDLGIEGDYEGIGHLILGYPAEAAKEPAPRKGNYIYRI
jgi:hypothetical protein